MKKSILILMLITMVLYSCDKDEPVGVAQLRIVNTTNVEKMVTVDNATTEISVRSNREVTIELSATRHVFKVRDTWDNSITTYTMVLREGADNRLVIL